MALTAGKARLRSVEERGIGLTSLVMLIAEIQQCKVGGYAGQHAEGQ